MSTKNKWLRQADMAKKHKKTRALMSHWVQRGILLKKVGEGGVILVKESPTFSKATIYST